MTQAPDRGELVAAVSNQEFTSALNRLGPFEAAPRLAVACSGGPDSMVLLALTQDWALRAGGSVTALIVDHGLREESAAEAEWAADQAVRLGVSSAILSLAGARHVSNLQARARAGRYGLLFEWCRAHGHLHLLVGHHRDDQSETVRMRAERGSGEDGLAAMAPVHERAHARVLRPLLDFPKARLQATLQARGLSSVSDPSNQDIRFDRVRIRQSPLTPDRTAQLEAATREKSLARRERERESAALLARACEWYPEGYARLDPRVFASAAPGIARRCLSAMLSAIGGRMQPPRRRKVEGLHEMIVNGALDGGRTLAGCRIVPHCDEILVVREAALVGQAIPATNNGQWDGRFEFTFAAEVPDAEIRKLGRSGLHEIMRDGCRIAVGHLPKIVRTTLPAVSDLEGVCEVPHLSYSSRLSGAGGQVVGSVHFAPQRPISATRFTI